MLYSQPFHPKPVLQCPVCGGTYFREVALQEFTPPSLLPAGFADPPQMFTWICLCGAPVMPSIQAWPGRSLRQVLERFLTSVKQVVEKKRSDELALGFLGHAGVPRTQLLDIQSRLSELERAASRQLLLQRGDQRRGRPWQPPAAAAVTPPASRTKGRQWLELQLRQCGFTAREAHAALTALMEAMVDGLRRDDFVETPIGEFYGVGRTQPYDRKRWGENQHMHSRQRRSVFKPDAAWLALLQGGRQ